ncbi:hypothetical protein [Mucilaginibacter polytrichastri]|uniref:Uncharacterized protein n=1 Tax=Mucilaginibacter polytrichastri TaxID=1302689 RepID=A0A1Q5ZT49_9SPHI|nr:hypothetical protein [Mucilaginibacter polytrichastri]OKS84917.1 hypothetical protein RG47T_0355 [Mucilaginibacter polytrichastri]SFS47660.1 hypothetical protein SAMN04487890_101718 [Mucilaginibacter polytrichastri]
MKDIAKGVFVGLFLCLLAFVILLGFVALDRKKQIEEKQSNITRLDSILKLNDRILKNKDSIIILKDKMINACNSNVKNLTSKPTSESQRVTGFTFGDKNISVEELLKITNNTLKENITLKKDVELATFKLKVIKDKFGLSYKDTTNKIILEDNPKSLLNKTSTLNTQVGKLNNQIDSLKADLTLNKAILDLIQKNYNIPYTIKGGTITIHYNKLDTLTDIYPLIKKRIRIKNGKIWLNPF